MNVKKPHPHAEVMKAYAEDCSLAIECRICDSEPWDIVDTPSFVPEFHYRIKPEPEIPKSNLIYSDLCAIVNAAHRDSSLEGISTKIARMAADTAIAEFIRSGEMTKYFMNTASGYVTKDNT